MHAGCAAAAWLGAIIGAAVIERAVIIVKTFAFNRVNLTVMTYSSSGFLSLPSAEVLTMFLTE